MDHEVISSVLGANFSESFTSNERLQLCSVTIQLKLKSFTFSVHKLGLSDGSATREVQLAFFNQAIEVINRGTETQKFTALDYVAINLEHMLVICESSAGVSPPEKNSQIDC